MPDNAIEIRNLYKGYDRHDPVLKGLSMTVPKGSIYGFIGQNGTGKSTTLNTLMGLLKADSGTVQMLGENSWGISAETKTHIAYVSEVSFHFSWLNVQQSLDYVAQFYPNWDREKAVELLSALKIQTNKKVTSLSLGQTRAVSLIAALCCNPDLLILDEPAGNLDVVARRLFQQYILDFAQQEGKTVLLSSHVLTDLERVVDRIGIIRDGKIIVEDELDTLKEQTRKIRLVYESTPPVNFDVPNLIQVETNKNEVRLIVSSLDEGLLPQYRCISGAKVEVRSMGLEDIFVAYSLAEVSPLKMRA